MENQEELGNRTQFTLEEDTSSNKLVYTIYGEKGSGKTSTSMNIRDDENDSILCVSFDNKSAIIKEKMFANDEKIKIFNGLKYLDKRPENLLETSKDTYNYLLHILNNFSPKWIIFDGLEVISKICENYMRLKSGYKPYSGITNMNHWKIRSDLLDNLHNMCFQQCKKGVIYTTYTTIKEEIYEGMVTNKKEIPKWFGNILMETDIVLKTFNQTDIKGNSTYKVYVDSSKNDDIFKSTSVYINDIENRRFIKDDN